MSKANQHFQDLKRVFSAFITPEQFDFWSRTLGSTHAWQRCFARVIAREEEGDKTFTLRLKPNRNFARFKAGQHVNVTVDIEGRRITRSYSFSGSPNKRGWIDITVRHDPDGQMSSWLYHHASKGSVLELESVFGDMTSDSFSGQPLVFLAGGSGITPLMALLRELAGKNMPRQVTLVYWERNESSFCFTKELDEMAGRFDSFSAHRIETAQQPERRINEAQLASLGVGICEAQVLACGSSAFVEQAKSVTQHQAHSFTSEAFTARAIEPMNDKPKSFTVELLNSNRRIKVSNQESLLTALEQQGVSVQSGCRMGVCNTCACEKVNGSTWNAESTQTDSSTYSNVRLCISRANSDLQLAL